MIQRKKTETVMMKQTDDEGIVMVEQPVDESGIVTLLLIELVSLGVGCISGSWPRWSHSDLLYNHYIEEYSSSPEQIMQRENQALLDNHHH